MAYLSKPITFEQSGRTFAIGVLEDYPRFVEGSRYATPTDLAAAGYMRVPSVEELARALYSVEDVAATTYGVDVMPWERSKEEIREEYRETARAVLRALGVMGDVDD